MAILFANDAEVLMGSTDDPPDGAAVARTCLGAVGVYAVALPSLSPNVRYFLHFVDVRSSCIDVLEGLN